MRYEGLSPLAQNEPLIEIQVGGRSIDLYNRCTLDQVTFTGQALAFWFRAESGAEFALEFGSVRGLTVAQPDDWDPREARQIDHLLVRDPGPWREVEFNAGGLKYEFDAEWLGVRGEVGAPE